MGAAALEGPVQAWLDRHVAPGRPLALACSGGGDSHALLCLLAPWARRTATSVTVLTVDHGLRAASAGESRHVVDTARRLGFAADRLVWHGDKPASGLQRAARDARHDLLARACRARGIGVLLTGHTLDDQAETVLMRLAAGGGWRSAAGIAPVSASPAWPAGKDLVLLRPLLGTRRAALRAWLRDRGETWVDDPGNDDPRYTRTRMRRRLAGLGARGFDPERLSDLAADCRGVLEVEARAADRLAARFVSIKAWGGAALDRDGLLTATPAIRRRLLAALALAISGQRHAPDPARLDRLEAALAEGIPATASGVPLLHWQGRAWLVRDSGPVLGRVDRPARDPMTVLDRDVRVWDGRFQLDRAASPGEPGPLGRDAAGLENRDVLSHIPPAARSTLLAFRHDRQVVHLAGLPPASGIATDTVTCLAAARFCRHLLPGEGPPWFDASSGEAA